MPSLKRILLLQGENLKELGTRQPELYGTTSASELDALLLEHARLKGYNLEIFYTDSELEAINRIREADHSNTDGLIVNPGGFTDTASELRDFLRQLRFPYVEVHITNLAQRGIHSITAQKARGIVMGLGLHSYILALEGMLHILDHHSERN